MSDLLGSVVDTARAIHGLIRPNVYPCGRGENRHTFGLPGVPINVDVYDSASVVGSSGTSWASIASHTVSKSNRALIRGFGVSQPQALYSGMSFRLTVNGNAVTPWTDYGHPPGGLSPESLCPCLLEVGAGAVVAVEARHTDPGVSLTVYARLVGAEFPCP